MSREDHLRGNVCPQCERFPPNIPVYFGDDGHWHSYPPTAIHCEAEADTPVIIGPKENVG